MGKICLFIVVALLTTNVSAYGELPSGYKSRYEVEEEIARVRAEQYYLNQSMNLIHRQY